MVRDIALVGLFLAEQGWRGTREHSAGNPFPFTKHLRVTSPMSRTPCWVPCHLWDRPSTQPSTATWPRARIFLPRARHLAEQTGHPWPQAYEDASVAYFERSLGVQIET